MPADHSSTSVEYRLLPEHLGYRFGSDGSIWSRWYRRRLGYGKGVRMILVEEWKRMTPGIGARPYFKVTLMGRKCRVVHRLILEAFVGPRPDGLQCRHLNGDLLDNRIENLAWGTAKENGEDKARHGTASRGAVERETRRKILADINGVMPAS